VGEAKRRRHTPSETRPGDRLPDFIFGRDKTTEEAYGFLLAGKLVTDIPKHKQPSEDDQQLIAELIQWLAQTAQRDPDLDEAGVWRDGVKPPDGLSPPFPDDAIQARVDRCLVVGVRVDPRNDGFLRLDDVALAEIMGRH
jgi:hypothetical protein